MVKEETSIPEWIPRTRVHCMVKLGRLGFAFVASAKRNIRSESLGGGGCEAVQELVREIPAICGSGPTQFV